MEDKYSIKEDLKHEFQLERMILFSDAVFAIVITLMAIELKVPDIAGIKSSKEIVVQLLHLAPEFFAYVISFLFIGFSWYQHLQLFSIVKNYDKGLVFRNLLMLFFISLFPFSASLSSKTNANIFVPMAFYFLVLLLCVFSRMFLAHYLLYKRPNLCYKGHIDEYKIQYKKSRLAILLLIVFLILVIITYKLIPSVIYKNFAWFWYFLLPFVQKKLEKKIGQPVMKKIRK